VLTVRTVVGAAREQREFRGPSMWWCHRAWRRERRTARDQHKCSSGPSIAAAPLSRVLFCV